MFIRKLYYHTQTGEVLHSFMAQGAVRLTTTEEDAAAIPALVEAGDALGVFVWTEPDAQVEANMAAATGIRVDVSGTPHTIVYDYTPLPEEATLDDALAALEEIGINTNSPEGSEEA